MHSNLFQFLIDPISPEAFSRNYWESAHLVINRNSEPYFENILNEGDINTFLGRKDLYYPFVRLVKNGEEIQKSTYLKNSVITGIDVIDTDKVFSLYNSGSTIIIQKAQLSIEKIAKFCEQLEHELNFSLSANLYITPKNSKGFNPHYDTHDVFILQISGKKYWHLYNSAITLPLSHQPLSKIDSENYLDVDADSKIELSPGDLIYIPRGCVHNAFTKDSDSVHITLGAFPHKRIELFKKMLEKAETQIEFRKYLPTKLSAQAEREFFIENFKTVIKAFIDDFSINELLSLFENNFLAERFPNNKSRFLSNKNLNDIGLETLLITKENLSFKLDIQNNEYLSLRFFDKEMKFPIFIEPSLKSIINSSQIKIRDIGGFIDDESKIVLAKRLLLEGFLNIAENGI